MLFLVFGPGLQVVNDRVGLQDKCVKMPTRLRSFLSPSDLDFDQNLYLELSTIFRRRVDQSTDISVLSFQYHDHWLSRTQRFFLQLKCAG